MSITNDHPSAVMFKKKEDYLAEASTPGRPPHQPEPSPQPKPQPEPDPNEPEEATAPPPIAFSAAAFEKMMSKFEQAMGTAIAEARKPIRDERVIARLQRMKEHNHAMQKDQRETLIARFHNCNHMQLPGSVMTGCSCIAWATQSDQKKRGVCQHCGTIFSSERSECLNDEIYESYKMMVRMPTHPAGNFNTIFQSA